MVQMVIQQAGLGMPRVTEPNGGPGQLELHTDSERRLFPSNVATMLLRPMAPPRRGGAA
jgi:hypothetical protein